MFTGVNGDLLYGRIEELAKTGKELMVTEFDVQDLDHVRKAEDVEDFMRIAFSHKDISMILLWSWLKTAANSDSWHKTFWEGQLGDEAVEKPTGIRLISLQNYIWWAKYGPYFC